MEMLIPLSGTDPTATAPNLVYSGPQYDTICCYAQTAGHREVMGYSFAVPMEAPRASRTEWFRVLPDLIIPRQVVSEAGVDVMPEGESAVGHMEDALDERYAEEFPDGVTRVMWHSHMGGHAGFSDKDVNTHHNFALWPFMMFVVVNRYGEASGNFEQYQPRRMGGPLNLWVAREVPDALTITATIKQQCVIRKLPARKSPRA
ncbi:hypothetical protein IPG36_07830 [bacterium]|nr:MAG: hypothetical protein IPG36_07830 [bacterium]